MGAFNHELSAAGLLHEALDWVKRCPHPVPGPSEIEIRPLYEMSDFS